VDEGENEGLLDRALGQKEEREFLKKDLLLIPRIKKNHIMYAHAQNVQRNINHQCGP